PLHADSVLLALAGIGVEPGGEHRHGVAELREASRERARRGRRASAHRRILVVHQQEPHQAFFRPPNFQELPLRKSTYVVSGSTSAWVATHASIVSRRRYVVRGVTSWSKATWRKKAKPRRAIQRL